MPEHLVTWTTLAAFIGGIAAKAANDWLSARLARQREREARSEARGDLLRQRRADFQRETLVALQDACMKLLRATAQTHIHDIKTLRNTGHWQVAGIPADMDEAARLAQASVTTLVVRVRDEEVRRLVHEIQEVCLAVGKSRDEAASRRHMDELNPLHEQFNNRAGQILRDLDADPSALIG